MKSWGNHEVDEGKDLGCKLYFEKLKTIDVWNELEDVSFFPKVDWMNLEVDFEWFESKYLKLSTEGDGLLIARGLKMSLHDVLHLKSLKYWGHKDLKLSIGHLFTKLKWFR